MHAFLFSYVIIQVAIKEIKFSSVPFNHNMTIFNWAGYISFGFFIKLLFTAMMTTFIALFVFLFPSIFELFLGLAQNRPIQFGKLSIVNLILLLITAGVFAPVWEELFYRGVLLRKFMKRYSVISSIFLSSLLFAIFHGGLFSIVNAFIMGCFLSYVYIIRKNIWIPIIIHSINNIVSILLSTFTSPVDPTAFEELSSYEVLLQDLIIPVLITTALTAFFLILFSKGYRRVQKVQLINGVNK